MRAKHPKASVHILEHVASLEVLLDTSILSGFSYGAAKAEIAVISGTLLGHQVGRNGASCSPDRTDAIWKFPALKTASHVRQFLGSTNWVRWYLPSSSASAVKILGEFMRPNAVFPKEGLGPGSTRGCKAVRVIKLMAKNSIETAVLDVASAVDGSLPLETVADSCGYGWGRRASKCLQT